MAVLSQIEPTPGAVTAAQAAPEDCDGGPSGEYFCSSTSTLVDEDTDKKAVWQIVGEPEADAKKGRISITSPLARALIGKKKGASVEVVAPGGAKAYEITKVEWR